MSAVPVVYTVARQDLAPAPDPHQTPAIAGVDGGTDFHSPSGGLPPYLPTP
jgi:hypothetical protein